MGFLYNKYKLSDDDLLWQPYSGKEVLTFQSEKGELDSIFINAKIERHIGPNGQDWRLFPDKYETLDVRAKHSDPYPPGNLKHRYLNGCILRLNSMKEKDELWIQFLLRAKKACFYDKSRKKSELKKLPSVKLSTPYKQFNDVIILESKDEKYKKREDYIERVYWSMKEGYIRYDLKNGRYWELIEKKKSGE